MLSSLWLSSVFSKERDGRRPKSYKLLVFYMLWWLLEVLKISGYWEFDVKTSTILSRRDKLLSEIEIARFFSKLKGGVSSLSVCAISSSSSNYTYS